MADKPSMTKLDFTHEELRIIHSALVLKRASVDRAVRAESDPVIKQRRAQVAALVDMLSTRIASAETF